MNEIKSILEIKVHPSRSLCSLMLILLTVGCQNQSTPPYQSKTPPMNYGSLSTHSQAECLNLEGTFRSTNIDFNFRKRGGYLVISTRTSKEGSFAEIITVSGVQLDYSDGGRAEAKCVQGRVFMLHTSSGGLETEIQIEPQPDGGFFRHVKKSKNAPVTTAFVKLP